MDYYKMEGLFKEKIRKIENECQKMRSLYEKNMKFE
jgi:hypothetical protein